MSDGKLTDTVSAIMQTLHWTVVADGELSLKAKLSPRDMVRSSDIWRELGVKLLLLQKDQATVVRASDQDAS